MEDIVICMFSQSPSWAYRLPKSQRYDGPDSTYLLTIFNILNRNSAGRPSEMGCLMFAASRCSRATSLRYLGNSQERRVQHSGSRIRLSGADSESPVHKNGSTDIAAIRLLQMREQSVARKSEFGRFPPACGTITLTNVFRVLAHSPMAHYFYGDGDYLDYWPMVDTKSRRWWSLSLDFCFLSLAAFATSLALAADVPRFHMTAVPGPYAVGFKVVEQYDYSRTFRRPTDELGHPYHGERARPLQSLIWYPARPTMNNRMTVGDYASLWSTETSFGKPRRVRKSEDWVKEAEPTLTMELGAARDAAPERGVFPAIIYAPGGSGVAWENVDLCEYLASYGYVVVSSPDMGSATRDMVYDVKGANVQATDISFLVGFLHTLPNADIDNVAVIGHSWGGLSGLVAAARDNRISALVGLDGSMRYYPRLIKEVGDVHPAQMEIPLLYFAQGDFAVEDQARYLSPGDLDAPSVLNEWTHGDLVFVHMLGLSHEEFSSKAQRSQHWGDDTSRVLEQADYGPEYGIEGYGWVARYTLSFLNAYLKHEGAAAEFLKKPPQQVGVPPRFLTVSYRPAVGLAASLESFRREVGRLGFDHAVAIYASMHKDNPTFSLSEEDLGYWSQELIGDRLLVQAVALLELDVDLHADSAAAHRRLGDAYADSGKLQLASASYQKSLDLEPTNAALRRKLLSILHQDAVAKRP